MIEARTRALLDRYSLATRVLSNEAGERMAREPGQSVEFHDFRQYMPGDELRYVDWRAYARTGRLYTRLHQAERTLRLHLLLDTSRSMQLHGKADFMNRLSQQLLYLAQRESLTQVHSFSGRHSRPALGVRAVANNWRFLDELAGDSQGPTPGQGVRGFATSTPLRSGRALVLVLSDLLDPEPLRPALIALRSRGFDVSFLQLLAEEELDPQEDMLELEDVESAGRLPVGPAEVRAYRQAVLQYVNRTRSAIMRAGFRHLLLRVPDGTGGDMEKQVFQALLRSGIIIRR